MCYVKYRICFGFSLFITIIYSHIVNPQIPLSTKTILVVLRNTFGITQFRATIVLKHIAATVLINIYTTPVDFLVPIARRCDCNSATPGAIFGDSRSFDGRRPPFAGCGRPFDKIVPVYLWRRRSHRWISCVRGQNDGRRPPDAHRIYGCPSHGRTDGARNLKFSAPLPKSLVMLSNDYRAWNVRAMSFARSDNLLWWESTWHTNYGCCR